MAAIFSPSALLSSSSSTTKTHPKSPQQSNIPLTNPPLKLHPLKSATTTTAAAIAAILISTTPLPSLADTPTTYNLYYGTAASASNYGGYGGNSNKKDSAEYIYDVPDGWKERLISKVEKGTNGTDSEFFNPKKRTEKEYLTFLSGYRQLAPKDIILNNLALSDVLLQDLIGSADKITSEEKKDEKGQTYYNYEIDGASAHSLISVTCANNKIYAHFVNAPAAEWTRDQEMLKHLHASFKTVAY